MDEIANSNVTCPDDEECYRPYEERAERYIVPIVFFIILVVGLAGNGTLVAVFSRHRRMRNTPNMYIFCLALGDLLVIVTCVPFTGAMYWFETWPFGTVICKLSEYARDVSVAVSVFTLTMLSAERYFAISNPIGKKISSKSFTRGIAITLWIIAAVFSLPSALFSHIVSRKLEPTGVVIEYCYSYPFEFGETYRKTVVMTKFLVLYAIPLTVIAVFYVSMATHLLETTRNIPGELQGQSSQIKARKKVAKMVLYFVGLFFICFLPHHVYQLWFHFHPSAEEDFNQFWNVFRIVGFCLSFFNSCINPIALYFVSGVFRRYFNRYLFCCCRLDNDAPAEGIVDNRSVSCRRLNTSASLVTRQLTLSNGDC